MKKNEIESNDDDINSSEFETDKDRPNSDKMDVRRKLDDYLEQKRLEQELNDY